MQVKGQFRPWFRLATFSSEFAVHYNRARTISNYLKSKRLLQIRSLVWTSLKIISILLFRVFLYTFCPFQQKYWWYKLSQSTIEMKCLIWKIILFNNTLDLLHCFLWVWAQFCALFITFVAFDFKTKIDVRSNFDTRSIVPEMTRRNI